MHLDVVGHMLVTCGLLCICAIMNSRYSVSASYHRPPDQEIFSLWFIAEKHCMFLKRLGNLLIERPMLIES
jgi:hypothetical protein